MMTMVGHVIFSALSSGSSSAECLPSNSCQDQLTSEEVFCGVVVGTCAWCMCVLRRHEAIAVLFSAAFC